MRRFLTILLTFSVFTVQAQQLIQFDTVFHKYLAPFIRVDNGPNIYPALPPRVEHYGSVAQPARLTATLTYNRGLQCGTISGKIITLTQQGIGVQRAWRKNMTGAGVPICVIDLGYPGNVSHQAITVTETFGLNPNLTYNHTTQIAGVVAARNNDSSGMLGIAYESPLYIAGLGDVPAAIRWALSKGVRVITISADINYYPDMVAAVAEAHYAGAIVLLAAGNDFVNHEVVDTMQDGCRIPWIVCVGSLVGGGPWALTDSFYTKQILPYGKKKLDFALWVNSIAPSFDTVDGANFPIDPPGHNNSYRIVGGTSFTAPQVGALCALLMQKYPRLSSRTIYHMLRYYSRPITSSGVTTMVPDFSKLR